MSDMNVNRSDNRAWLFTFDQLFSRRNLRQNACGPLQCFLHFHRKKFREVASGGSGPKNLGESPSARGWSFSPDLHSERAADDSQNITKPGYSLLIPHPILLDSKNWKYSGSELMLFYRIHVHVSESCGVVDPWLCPAITLIITLNSIQSQTAYGLRGHLS